MPGGHLLQFDIPDAGDGVGIDDELVAVGGGCADVGLGIEFIPHFQPGGYCVFIGFSADVQPLTLRHGCFRFFPNLRLRLTQHIFVEGKTAHYPYQASGRLPERDRDDSGKEGNAYQDFVPAVTVNPAEFQLI